MTYVCLMGNQILIEIEIVAVMMYVGPLLSIFLNESVSGSNFSDAHDNIIGRPVILFELSGNRSTVISM